MRVKMVTVSTDCSGEKQATAPTFRISKNMPRWIRSPLITKLTRARPDRIYHAMIDALIVNAISEPAATPRMPNCGTGPAQAERAAENDLTDRGTEHHQRRQFHVPGAAQDSGQRAHEPCADHAAEKYLDVADRLREHVAAAAEQLQQRRPNISMTSVKISPKVRPINTRAMPASRHARRRRRRARARSPRLRRRPSRRRTWSWSE